MLNKQEFETERFATDVLPTVTVAPELLKSAANDDVRPQPSIHAEQPRRARRQALYTSSPIGGWKVRMW